MSIEESDADWMITRACRLAQTQVVRDVVDGMKTTERTTSRNVVIDGKTRKIVVTISIENPDENGEQP